MQNNAPFLSERSSACAGPAVCLSVVVPVYNEVNSIRTVIERVQASPVPKEIIIVDDGSTDGTREFLETLKSLPGLKVVLHAKNQGKGAAIRTALNYVSGEYVVIQDADLEYDPQDFPALLEPLKRGVANVVYGVRPDRPDRGLHFYLCAKWLTWLANILYGARIHDEATCYKVFRRSTLARIPLECQGFEFCPEITAKICRLGERIYEVPISYNPRNSRGGKKIRWTDAWIAMWTLLRWRFQHFLAVTPKPRQTALQGELGRSLPKNASETDPCNPSSS